MGVGLSTIESQYREVVAPISGLFGFQSLLDLNLVLLIVDAHGKEITDVKVTFAVNGQPVSYQPPKNTAIYDFKIPVGTTAVTLARLGYDPQTFNVTVADGDFLTITRTMVLNVTPYFLILKRT